MNNLGGRLLSMSANKKPDQLVQSVDRALNIIEKLVQINKGVGVTELSNSLGLHKSTVHRLLATLNYRGYVSKDKQNNNYKVGLKLFEIGSIVINNLDLRKEVKPYLEEMMEKTNETVHLGILDQNEVVYIDKVESPETIRMYSKVGKRAPTHCTSLGKVLLAYSEEDIIKETIYNNELNKYTENTLVDPDELRKHLDIIKKCGYAKDNEEHEEGIRCISGPIFNYNGDVIAAFSIAGPNIRMTEEKIENLKGLVIDYSAKMSAAFGYNQLNFRTNY